MRRPLAFLVLAPLLGCGAHLHRPVDDQLARGAVDKLEALAWDEAFARDRGQRDALAQREGEIGRAYAEARREAELLDILTEPVGERSWQKLEDRLVELAACMLDEPGTGGGRACRAAASEAELARARELLFGACPAEGCAWVLAIAELRRASATLAEQLASYDRARGLAGLGEAVATPAQCPAPTRLPARLREPGERLRDACAGYDQALAAVAEALPEASGLRGAIADYLALAAARDGYREELRLLVARLGSLDPDRFDARALEREVADYLALQAKYALELAGAALGDFGDLALEGTLMITREHRAAIIRTLALLGERAVAAAAAAGDDSASATATGESFRSDAAPEAPPGTPPEPSDPSSDPGDPDPAGPDPDPDPPRPDPDPFPSPPDRTPGPDSQPDPSDPSDPDDGGAGPVRPPSEAERELDRELLRTLGSSLVPVFGEAWTALVDQRREAERGRLLLSAEIERIQIDAMTRRLASAEQRVWLELGAIETQLQALLRMRLRLDADWIPAARPSTPARTELDRLALERELAEAALKLAQAELDDAIAKFTRKPGKAGEVARATIADAKARVREAQAGADAAADAYNGVLADHGAALCQRFGSVAQTYARDRACVAPIERLIGLHAELVGAALVRLEQLDRSAARRLDEATLLRDQAGLEIRVTYIAASVAALQRFTAGGLESRDVAAIVGAVVGIGLGAAITAGVYIP